MSDDDDLLLPEEEEHGSSRKDNVIGSLFSQSTPVVKKEKKSLEDLFAQPLSQQTSLARKRPTVTFHDPPVSSTTNYAMSAAGKKLTDSTNMPSTKTSASSTELLDSLFATNVRKQRDSQQTKRTSSVRTERTPNFLSQNSQSKNTESEINKQELESLRREISTMQFEKSEDQEIIKDLRAKNASLTEDNKRQTEELSQSHKNEIKKLMASRESELEQIMKLEETQRNILTSVKQHEMSMSKIDAVIESIQNFTSAMENKLQLSNNQSVEFVQTITFAREDMQNVNSQLQSAIYELKNKENNALQLVDSELEKLTELYREEITAGRRWVQNERERLQAERQAFQEEQLNILNSIETKKEELQLLHSEFLKKEHDLVVRLVNERAQLQYMEQQFQLQRNADTVRIRKEAEELEICFVQIQQALVAIDLMRREYEFKHTNVT